MKTQRFSSTPSPMFPELHSGLPCMPITLLHGEQTLKVSALGQYLTLPFPSVLFPKYQNITFHKFTVDKD